MGADDTRICRLANMSEAQALRESFERDPDFDLRRYPQRSFGTFQEEPFDVALRFDPDAAQDAEAFLFHPTQTVKTNADGAL